MKRRAQGVPFRPGATTRGRIGSVPGKTFYLETFGCQMNVHDSEKVIGTLMARGYTQVETPEDADLVLYNTCSIRDKAEQKVFNRLQQFTRQAGVMLAVSRAATARSILNVEPGG